MYHALKGELMNYFEILSSIKDFENKDDLTNTQVVSEKTLIQETVISVDYKNT